MKLCNGNMIEPSIVSLLKIMLCSIFLVVAGFHTLKSNERFDSTSRAKTIIASGIRYENWDDKLLYFSEQDKKSFIESFGHLCMQDDDNRLYHSSIHGNLLIETYTHLENLSTDAQLNQRADEIRLDLWKFCAMGIGYAFAFVDDSQVFFQNGVHATDFLNDISGNIILQVDLEPISHHIQSSSKLINSAIIGLGQTESGRRFARSFVSALLSRTDALLFMDNYALWKGQQLFSLLQEPSRVVDPTEWKIISVTCAGLDLTGVYSDHPHDNSGLCLRNGGSPCCQTTTDVYRSTKGTFILLLHSVEKTTSAHREENEKFFYSRTKVVSEHSLNQPPSRFFDIMLENDCLPSHACHRCLSKQEGGDQKQQCAICKAPCACYCEALCKIRPLSTNISKNIYVQPPRRKRNAHRLIPRLIHQTYFEPITAKKYPNFSRLVNSWKASGWEYSFYNDEDAAKLLAEHFPPEVREAYDALVPGAYKADLFRYCVLFIFGGVYSDVDVMLSADLDVLIEDNIGFMVPVDEPGRSTNAGSCLWNGFLAASPGHPFLARTIQSVVNNVRNRATSVDIDDMLCPDYIHHRLPDLDLSHSFDLLYLTGPCILGGAINAVLGRHMQTHIVPGEIDIWNNTALDSISDEFHSIPGRTIILSQNKSDMGAHRFTYLEKNMLVAATDMPEYDDRKDIKHYSDSKKEKMQPLFGTKDVYHDLAPVHETVNIIFGPSFTGRRH